jgi:tripartite ATP-independent transporter DctP family solute receptor
MKKALVILFALSFAVFTAPAYAADFVIKAGLIDPPGHIDTKAAEKFAELVAQKTDGKVKIEIYPASQLGFAMDMLQGMKLGTVEMFIGATTWLGAFDKDFWISGCLYVFNDQEHARKVHEGEFFKKMSDRLAKNHGIRILRQDWDRGPRNFVSTKPLTTVADLEGLKVRVPEQKSWILNFKLAGANPTPIALVETFTGLQQGVVEATEQASNWLYFNKYHTIANNLTRSHHNYEETGVMISEKVYQSMPEEYRKAMVEAAAEAGEWHNQIVTKEIEEAEEKMAAEGINIIDPDVAAWQKHFRNNFPTLVEQVGYSQDLADYIMSEWK